MHRQHHGVERLGDPSRSHGHAGHGALNVRDRRGQARIQPLQDGVDVATCPTRHGVPLRPVLHLDKAVVVAKAHHSSHRETQHLVGRTAPDATQHGQEIPVAKSRAKAMLIKEVAQWLYKRLLLATFGQSRAQAVEAQELGEHAPKLRAQKVAPLGKHGCQVGATPLQCPAPQYARTWHLD